MTSTITITDLADVRDGDTVTVEFAGGTFVGPAYTSGLGDMSAGGWRIRKRDGAPGEATTFVSATREVPGLPTDPGSVILVHEINGEPVGSPTLAILADPGSDREWMALRPRSCYYTWHSAGALTTWETCVVTPSGEVASRG